MPTVTLDQRGLLIGGKRRWLVSGTIDPARTPSALWPERLDAAVAAGLTAVTVPAVWAVHEPRQGDFRFSGDQDLPAFIRLAGERGLLVCLRPGPFQGAGWDRGGLPAWVDPGMTEPKDENETPRPLALRSSSPAFLQACAAWIAALAARVRPLLATQGGPIALVQNEHRWFCGDPDHAAAYLGELARYLRENGLAVPALNTNNLFAAAEGEIDAWNGHQDLLATFRQLRAVRPDQPALAWDFELSRPNAWGKDQRSAIDPDAALHELAQAVAAGAQVNLGPFAGGSNFSFSAGRLPFERDAFAAQSAEAHAPLDEAGAPTPLLDALAPLLTFVSSFERLFSAAKWEEAAAAIAPGAKGVSVVQTRGDAGAVAFVLRDPADKKTKHADVLLADGRRLRVDLRDAPAVWLLQDAPFETAGKLDYASASVLWRRGRAIALTAPAGAEVELSINGSALTLTTPRGKTPLSQTHEGVAVHLLSTAQAAASAVAQDALLVGAQREGVPRPGHKSWTRLLANGEAESGTWDRPTTSNTRRTLTDWRRCATDDFTAGASERYAVIDGPATMHDLGADYGYGWLRWELKPTAARAAKAALPESADRVHLFCAGKPAGVFGLGAGATEDPIALPLKKGAHAVTALVDNLGRPSGGWSDLQKKGVWGPLYDVKPFRPGKPVLENGEPLHPLDYRSPLTRLHADDRTSASRVTWTFTHRRKSPLAVCFRELPEGFRALLIINDEVADCLDEASLARYVLDPAATGPLALRAGNNTVQLATLGDPETALKAATKAVFFECVADLAVKADWAFARWEVPGDRLFEPADKNDDASAGLPTWWRATFKADPAGEPLALDTKGLTKGHLFLNGHDLGRYWNADAGGKAVGGQKGHYLPPPWLEDSNELTIFDEHGATPHQVRVAEFRKLRG